MTTNTEENATFSKIYDHSENENTPYPRFPLIYARLLSPYIKYSEHSLYFLTSCDVKIIAHAVDVNLSETKFLRDFHWILDGILLFFFGVMLIYKVDLFTKEILSPIKQISAKFIEITQSAFNYNELREISFEDILIKVIFFIIKNLISL